MYVFYKQCLYLSFITVKSHNKMLIITITFLLNIHVYTFTDLLASYMLIDDIFINSLNIQVWNFISPINESYSYMRCVCFQTQTLQFWQLIKMIKWIRLYFSDPHLSDDTLYGLHIKHLLN